MTDVQFFLLNLWHKIHHVETNIREASDGNTHGIRKKVHVFAVSIFEYIYRSGLTVENELVNFFFIDYRRMKFPYNDLRTSSNILINIIAINAGVELLDPKNTFKLSSLDFDHDLYIEIFLKWSSKLYFPIGNIIEKFLNELFLKNKLTSLQVNDFMNVLLCRSDVNGISFNDRQLLITHANKFTIFIQNKLTNFVKTNLKVDELREINFNNNLFYEIFNYSAKQSSFPITMLLEKFLTVTSQNLSYAAEQKNIFIEVILLRIKTEGINSEDQFKLLSCCHQLSLKYRKNILNLIRFELIQAGLLSEPEFSKCINDRYFYMLLNESIEIKHYAFSVKLIYFSAFKNISLNDFEEIAPKLFREINHLRNLSCVSISKKIFLHPQFKNLSPEGFQRCFNSYLERDINEHCRISEYDSADNINHFMMLKNINKLSPSQKHEVFLIARQSGYELEEKFLIYLFDFESLADLHWGNMIPNIDKKNFSASYSFPYSSDKLNLIYFKRIMDLLKNEECLKIVPHQLLKKIIKNCQPSIETYTSRGLANAFIFYRYLFDLFKIHKSLFSVDEIDSNNRLWKNFKIVLDDGELEFPNYYKSILESKSDYFKLSKFSAPKNNIAQNIVLPSVTLSEFSQLFALSDRGKLKYKDLEMKHLIRLLYQSNFFLMNEYVEDILDHLYNRINQLNCTNINSLFLALEINEDIIIYNNLENRFKIPKYLIQSLSDKIEQFLKQEKNIDQLLIDCQNFNFFNFKINNIFLTDRGLDSFKWSYINKIEIENNSLITSEGFSKMFTLKTLENLHLHKCQSICDEVFIHFRGLKLKHISITNCKLITGSMLSWLSCNDVKSLCLNNCSIDDNALKIIKNMSNLRKLDISQNNAITNSGILNLQDSHKLISLNLNWCLLTSRTISYIYTLSIESLYLAGMKNLKLAVPSLIKMPLRRLDLRSTNISDDELFRLNLLPLHYVNLRNCEKVSMGAMVNLATAIKIHSNRKVDIYA